MKRISVRPTFIGLGAAALVAVIVGVSLAPDLGADATGASPVALKRIDQKNHRAALEAAARMRAESHATATRADSLRAAEDRGRAAAEAAIARFADDESGLDRSRATARQ